MKKVITVLGIAAVCHGLNKALCESQGDTSQVDWDKAEDWQKESAVKGVQFALANPTAPPSAQHEAWMADKIAEGWKYGQVKDAVKKEHPALVPYEELPNSQKSKDYIFKQTVAELAPYISEEGDSSADISETPPKPEFETNLAKGDDVMVKTGGPKMKVEVVFNTSLGVKAHCTWPLGKNGGMASDVFFEHNLHKLEAVQEEAKKEEEGPTEPAQA